MIDPGSNKYLQPQDRFNDNQTFFTLINQLPSEREQLDLKDIKSKVDRVVFRLRQLDQYEINEWKDTYLRKIMQLSQKIKHKNSKFEQVIERGKLITDVLKQQLRIFVCSSDICRIAYDKELIAKITAKLYFDEYHEDVLPYFKKAGYQTSEFQALKYEQENTMSFFGFCCCWIANE